MLVDRLHPAAFRLDAFGERSRELAPALDSFGKELAQALFEVARTQAIWRAAVQDDPSCCNGRASFTAGWRATLLQHE